MDSPAPEAFSLVQAEHETLRFWQERAIFAKSLEQNRGKTPYIFYDGPPFATGLPHHGHLLASTLKDIAPRYFTMQGYFAERRFGWDCHGLPIEHEIDKQLGMSAQDAVKQLGVKGYNDQCRGIVQKYTQEWRTTITRLGRWVDFDHAYRTMDVNYMESVWWIVKQLWDRKLLYRGTKVVPYSTQLQTVLSNFEAGLDYRQVQDPAVTVLFKLRDENCFIAAWTTTPWTLPSNLALCVGPEITYVKVHDEELGCALYLAEAALATYGKRHSLKVLERCQGQQLKGRHYLPLFDYFKDRQQQGAFQVLADHYVTTETGTGIVHMAPAFGEDDSRVMAEAKISATACPLDEAGRFTDEVADLAGQYVKDADRKIMQKLRAMGHLYQEDTYVHSYPFCYRSQTPLIYRSIPTWYVKVSALREQLLASNAQINWVPAHIKEGRFGKWLANARDWAIGRHRVWGTPIPIWINQQTGQMDCLGSIDQLAEVSGTRVSDLHREHVDPITYSKPGEEGTYRRIPEVLDCWFESGSMPYAQAHYPFENQQQFEQNFPAEFISEGLDQTRGWFYTLTVLSTALFQRPAFKNVIVSGLVMAEDGKKMSKSQANFTPPQQLLETHGADALRLYLINSGLVKGEEQRFVDSGVKDMVRRVLLPWYHAYQFLHTYAQVDGWSPQQHYQLGSNITDRWILSRLQTLTETISREMESYRLYHVIPPLFAFIDDLTNCYIRLNRRRFWAAGKKSDKHQAYSTLFTTIRHISTLMAPFAPFLSDYIFRQLAKLDPSLPESVHLCSYPQPDSSLVDPALEDAMQRMQQIIFLGRQKRNQQKIKVKIPLQTLSILHKKPAILSEIAKLESYIKSELNVKEVRYAQDEENYIELYARPNSPVLGKQLGKDFAHYRKLIENLSSEQCVAIESGHSLRLGAREFGPKEVLILRKPKPHTQALSNSRIAIDLDCQLNDELLCEGLAREVVNRIQKTRKDLGLKVSDRIAIEFSATGAIATAIDQHRAYIAQEVLATGIVSRDGLPETAPCFDIDQEQLQISLVVSG